MPKPKVTTNCVANSRTEPNERIIEYSVPSPKGTQGLLGGLIAFRLLDDGTLLVNLYQHDAGVDIRVSPPA